MLVLLGDLDRALQGKSRWATADSVTSASADRPTCRRRALPRPLGGKRCTRRCQQAGACHDRLPSALLRSRAHPFRVGREQDAALRRAHNRIEAAPAITARRSPSTDQRQHETVKQRSRLVANASGAPALPGHQDRLGATGWTPSTRPASATKTPPWWTYSRSAHRPSAIPEHGERRRHSAGNGSDLHGAAHR